MSYWFTEDGCREAEKPSGLRTFTAIYRPKVKDVHVHYRIILQRCASSIQTSSTSTVRLPFDCNSTALRPLNNLRNE